jgi:CubicO group peptidase (beta-lactamase class C family)
MRMKTVCMALLINVCMLFQAEAASVTEKDRAPQNIEELKQEVKKAMLENHVPGIGIVVVSQGQVEWEGAIGMADPAAGRPADADTLFRIGSISKGFVALAALKLQEEGKLNLNDTFKKWAPEIALDNRWEAGAPVRLVHLLEHTSGLNDIGIREYGNNEAQPVPLKTALDLYPSLRATRWPPGSRYSYSNMGPALVAYAIEKASGQRFEDYIQQQFFTPLGMHTATYFRPDERRFAGQYSQDGKTRLPYWHILYRPSGSINASPRDMAAYLRFFLTRGRAANMPLLTPLLPAAAIERMERCETLPMCRQGVTSGYGLHSYGSMDAGMRFQGHDGAVDGTLATLGYLPRQGSGYVVMLNSGNGAAAWRIKQLVTRYLASRLPPAVPSPGVAVGRDNIARYGGYYRGISPRQERMHGVGFLFDILKVTLDDKGMTTTGLATNDTQRWIAVGNGLFRKEADPEATVALYVDAAGQPHIQSMQGTLARVPAVLALGPVVLALVCVVLMLSAPLFALVWGIRKWRGRLVAPGPLHVRVLPLLASLALVATAGVVLLIGVVTDPRQALASPTPASVALLAVGLAFAALSAVAAVAVWRARGAVMHRGVYWHSALVALACVTSAGYLLSWGMIGMPTWGM